MCPRVSLCLLLRFYFFLSLVFPWCTLLLFCFYLVCISFIVLFESVFNVFNQVWKIICLFLSNIAYVFFSLPFLLRLYLQVMLSVFNIVRVSPKCFSILFHPFPLISFRAWIWIDLKYNIANQLGPMIVSGLLVKYLGIDCLK